MNLPETTRDGLPPNDTAELEAAKPVPSSQWALVAIILIAILVLIAMGPATATIWRTIRANLETWQAQADEHFLPALLIFFAVYCVTTSISLPVVTCMSLLAGALFGRWTGTIVASLAYTVGVTFAFLLARYFFRDRIQRTFGRRLQRFQRGIQVDGAFYLLTLRLIPSIPYSLVNLVMALTTIRLKTYIVVSWIGVLPYTFLNAGIGTELAAMNSPADVLSWPVVVSFIALATFPLLIRKVLHWLNPARLQAHAATTRG